MASDHCKPTQLHLKVKTQAKHATYISELSTTLTTFAHLTCVIPMTIIGLKFPPSI